VASDIGDTASEALVTSITACHHYRMWRELTDWYELKPDERSQAVAAMRRAATDWLSVKDDAAAQERYFERWRAELKALVTPLTPGRWKALAYLPDFPPEG
jgi:hypothetical protein